MGPDVPLNLGTVVWGGSVQKEDLSILVYSAATQGYSTLSLPSQEKIHLPDGHVSHPEPARRIPAAAGPPLLAEGSSEILTVTMAKTKEEVE